MTDPNPEDAVERQLTLFPHRRLLAVAALPERLDDDAIEVFAERFFGALADGHQRSRR